MIVAGAGMAGLLAAGMLRNDCSAVLETQQSLPNNHSAVLRFRSTAVGDALNIRFKEVQAIKAVQPWMNPVADAMAYSIKTNGTATVRSVLTADAKPVKRYIAPEDMVERMANRVQAPICFGLGADFLRAEEPVISTIPMPALMSALDWPGQRPEFRSVVGCNYGARLQGVNAYCSVYVPDPMHVASRVSLTGDQLIVECYGPQADDLDMPLEDVLVEGMRLLGLGLSRGAIQEPWQKGQQYAKILPIDEGIRREFIMWASREHNVHSLGRFATWRPGLLLDDLVNDVRVIQSLADNKGASYAHQLKGN
jgi:hypothetical protein